MGAPAPVPGTYAQFPMLRAHLPALIRLQRKLADQLAPLDALQADEKDVRAQILALLDADGIAPGDRVTCLGYDVLSRTRAGVDRLNPDVATEQFVAGGVARDFVDEVFAASTTTGDPAFWAEVKPTKGAAVRAPIGGKKRMAKAK